MSYRFLNHFTALYEAIGKTPNNIAFKVPCEDGNTWKNITYQQVWDDITRLAVYWSKLEGLVTADDSGTGARKKPVVGLWTKGKRYTDVIHVFSLQRAGHTLHLMSPYIENVDLVQNLFKQSGARIIFCDTKNVKGWEQLEKEAGLRVIALITDEEAAEIIKKSPTIPELNALPSLDDGEKDDILFIVHTSGSSSGLPKLVPHTRRWIDANAQKWLKIARRTPVFLRRESFSYHYSLRIFLYADCMILTPKPIWEVNELPNIITQCGVTDITLHPSVMNGVIEKAKTSALLSEKLRTLNSFVYGGGPLDERAIESAKEMGINITCLLSSTEAGLLMVSEPGEPHLLKLCHKFDYEFIPIKDPNGNESIWEELVILPTSPDCPSPALRDPTDGKFHTKDLFEAVENGYYRSRGRKDDIIIMEDADNCDAKYLEDEIAHLCHDLISCFVVVGQGRPSPAILVEPRFEFNITILHNTLSIRLESLNSAKTVTYPHERIKPEHIIILPKDTYIDSLRLRN
ncbi:hypothetical protein Clacol_003337 [Clathrus columnatus]|uniref:AMP-dependent synthetase/ligase domain-containing protein n=1 Tax=Clathrus columnatus TaxID=1419009 RepID=A0AAV5AB13_9AGAM|nr:hypothetical protein Clacol_003337 [Clathrus columnatus]